MKYFRMSCGPVAHASADRGRDPEQELRGHRSISADSDDQGRLPTRRAGGRRVSIDWFGSSSL